MGHSHDHGESLTGRRLVLSIFLTLAFVAGEAFAGYFAHSLALLSDAGHNFADALALVFSWYGIWIARKPSTQKRTFGYHRVGILAALVNAVSLVLIALLIFWESFQRRISRRPTSLDSDWPADSVEFLGNPSGVNECSTGSNSQRHEHGPGGANHCRRSRRARRT